MPFLNLSDIDPRELIPGYHGRLVHGEEMTVAFWEIDEGAPVPHHDHVHEQMVIVLEGEFELTLEGETRTMRPGDVALVGSHASHDGRALTACRLIDVFVPVREEYR